MDKWQQFLFDWVYHFNREVVLSHIKNIVFYVVRTLCLSLLYEYCFLPVF